MSTQGSEKSAKSWKENWAKTQRLELNNAQKKIIKNILDLANSRS
jgi:hypothetical protein